jgi:MoxR-like ATPase/uncharacterized protein with von Willebrand factor type A (vWA) domain
MGDKNRDVAATAWGLLQQCAPELARQRVAQAAASLRILNEELARPVAEVAQATADEVARLSKAMIDMLQDQNWPGSEITHPEFVPWLDGRIKELMSDARYTSRSQLLVALIPELAIKLNLSRERVLATLVIDASVADLEALYKNVREMGPLGEVTRSDTLLNAAPEVRLAYINAGLQGHRVMDALGVETVVHATQDMVGTEREATAAELLTEIFDASGPDSKNAVMKLISTMTCPAARACMLRAIFIPDTRTSHDYVSTALEGLATLKDPALISEIREALGDGTSFQAAQYLVALIRLGDPEALPQLEDYLKTPRLGQGEDSILQGIQLLIDFGRRDSAMAILQSRLQQQQRDYGLKEALLLDQLGHPQAHQRVIEAIRLGQIIENQRVAMTTLREAHPILMSQVRHINLNLKDNVGSETREGKFSRAVDLLSQIPDLQDLDVILKHLEGHVNALFKVSASLRRYNSPRVVAAFERGLDEAGRLPPGSTMKLICELSCLSELLKISPEFRDRLKEDGQLIHGRLDAVMEAAVQSDMEARVAQVASQVDKLEKWSSPSFSIIRSLIPGPEALTVVGSTAEVLQMVTAAIMARIPVFLQGETGTGKNAIIRYLAHLTQTPLYRINFGKETDESQLYGHLTFKTVRVPSPQPSPRGGGGNVREFPSPLGEGQGEGAGKVERRIVIEDGKMIQAMEKGGWCIWDEINLASPAFLVAQNDVLQQMKTGVVWVKQNDKLRRVKVHEHFRLFATGNPESYSGRSAMERSFGDRWQKIAVRPFNVEDQQTILKQQFTGLSEKMGQRIPEVLHELKVSLGGGITIRTVKRVAGRVQEGSSLYSAIEAEVLDGLNPDQLKVAELALSKALSEEESPLPAGEGQGEGEAQLFDKEIAAYRAGLAKTPSPPPSPEGEGAWEDLVPVLTAVRYARKVLDSLKRGDNILLEGPPARMKSAVAKWLGKLANQPVVEITGDRKMSATELIGQQMMTEDQQLRFIEGHVLEAMKSGSILIINEANLIPASILERLNSLLDDDRMIFVTEDGVETPVKAHPNFRLVFTQNPADMQGGRIKHSPALENKFRKIWMRDGFTREEKAKIAAEYTRKKLGYGKGAPLSPLPVGEGGRRPGEGEAQVNTPSPQPSPSGGGTIQVPLTTSGAVTLNVSHSLGTRTAVTARQAATGAMSVVMPRQLNTIWSDKKRKREITERDIEKAIEEVKRINAQLAAVEAAFMQQHGDTLRTIGKMAGQKFVRVEVDREVDIAALNLETGTMKINPHAILEEGFTPEQIMAIAMHEGGHAAISRIGNGYFFEKKSRHLLANCLEDPRVNEYELARFPGARTDFTALYNQMFPDSKKMVVEGANSDEKSFGEYPHEQLAYGFLDFWANGRISERVTNPRVREALEQLTPVAQQIWATRPSLYSPPSKEINARQNEVYRLIRERILPTYEELYQESVKMMEEELKKQQEGEGEPGKSGKPGRRGGGSIDPEDLSREARKKLEERAGRMADKLEPQQVPPDRKNRVNDARGRGEQKENEAAGKSGAARYKEGDFRPYDQKTYADILKERSVRKAQKEEFYADNPWRKSFDPIEKQAKEVAEALRQVLKLDEDFEWEGDFSSGQRLNIKKLIDVLIKNDAGIFNEDDLKLFLRRNEPSKRSHRFVLVLDESGSMKGKEVQRAALQAMALFKYVMQELRVHHGIVGFANYADIHLDINENVMNENALNGLMDDLENSNSGGTNDLEGLRVADDILADEDADEKTVIVVTDGEGVDTTKDYVKEMEARGVQVIGIGIGEGTESVTKVYTHHYQSHDFNTLSQKLLQILMKRMLGIQ